MTEPLLSQVEVEDRMFYGGVKRAQAMMETAEKAGRAITCPYGQSILRDYVVPASQIIELDLKPKVGRKRAEIALLNGLDPMAIALLGVRATINTCMAHGTTADSRAVANEIGKAIHGELVLTQIEEDYDLVIIDTPPSINALTRTAWVASDRVIIVTEPSLYSVIAADRAKKAIAEISAKLTPRLELLGVVVNRLRPQSNEHDYRLKELKEMFGNQLLMPYFEERAAIQQSTGAARPIHSWPAEGAAEVAKGFDWLLAGALSAMERISQNPDRASSGRATRGMGNPITELMSENQSRKETKKRRWFGR